MVARVKVHPFCDHCEGCRPAIIDVKTGAVLADSSKEMQAILRMWRTDTTYAQRKAFIDVTVHNSRVGETLRLAQEVVAKIATILEDCTVVHMKTKDL